MSCHWLELTKNILSSREASYRFIFEHVQFLPSCTAVLQHLLIYEGEHQISLDDWIVIHLPKKEAELEKQLIKQNMHCGISISYPISHVSVKEWWHKHENESSPNLKNLNHTLAVILLFIGAELSPNTHSWVLESFKKPPSLLVSMIYKY